MESKIWEWLLHWRNVLVTSICSRVLFVVIHSPSFKLYDVCRTVKVEEADGKSLELFFSLNKWRQCPSQQDNRVTWWVVCRCLFLCVSVCVVWHSLQAHSSAKWETCSFTVMGRQGEKVVNEICEPQAQSSFLGSCLRKALICSRLFFSSVSEICTLHFSASVPLMLPHTQDGFVEAWNLLYFKTKSKINK